MPHLFGVSWQWPAICEVCGRWPSHALCTACQRRHGQSRPRCPTCALPLAPGLARCQDCTTRPPGPLQGCAARVTYQYPWSDIVARFKFHGEPGWATPMAQMMTQDPAIQQLLRHCDLWAPIPLPPKRLRQRGYNQAWELTKALYRNLASHPAIEHHPDLLVHSDDTHTQHTLDRSERAQHAAQVLHPNPKPPTRVAARHVLLIDDVMTTGTTLAAAAQCLLSQGAASVHGLVFARTPATRDT